MTVFGLLLRLEYVKKSLISSSVSFICCKKRVKNYEYSLLSVYPSKIIFEKS
nr:MAG TPA: hypothetical protein [Caudoviricetes sp.]